jgi:hypothetical protein
MRLNILHDAGCLVVEDLKMFIRCPLSSRNAGAYAGKQIVNALSVKTFAFVSEQLDTIPDIERS